MNRFWKTCQVLIVIFFHKTNSNVLYNKDCLFVCFIVLRPKSTAMVMAGRSVHLTTLFFLDNLEQAVNLYFVHILSRVTDNNPA